MFVPRGRGRQGAAAAAGRHLAGVVGDGEGRLGVPGGGEALPPRQLLAHRVRQPLHRDTANPCPATKRKATLQNLVHGEEITVSVHLHP